jgi:hypothetical protein
MYLFDSHESAAYTLASFVTEGIARGEQVLLVARLEDWNRAAVKLASDQTLADALMSGQLVVRDSGRILGALLVDGWPSRERFDKTVGDLIESYAGRNEPLRVYGDMVDLLAADGRFEGAEQLEVLWNDLRVRLQAPLTLLCGYSSAHFSDAASTGALRRLRALHSHQQCGARDFVARHLLEPSRSS